MNGFWARGLVSALLSVCAGLLMGVARGHLWVSLLDTLCVGLGCWFCVDGLRARVARWRWQRLGFGASASPAPDGSFDSWPGWGWMVACGVLGAALGGTGGVLLARWLAIGLGLVPDAEAWRALPGHGAAGFAISMLGTLGVALGLSFVVYARQSLSQSLKATEEARRLAAESQLRLLQAQLEPHMLFNTLANLRVLITLDPPQAQAMLDRLISFLRATLSASRGDLHPLSDEFDRLGDYLSLMQVRMGDRLRTHLSLPDELRSRPVPPLLLQPLVENALLHGLEPKLEGGDLWVEARFEEAGRFCIRVRDSGLGLDQVIGLPGAPRAPAGSEPSTRDGGFGLQQVRDRLAATWGEAASLTLNAVPLGGTEAVLVLPMNPSTMP